MKELSLHILDIAENAYAAGATLVSIDIREDDTLLCFSVTDNGCGMSGQALAAAFDPFYTTKRARTVGLGLPLLRLAAEQSGGWARICAAEPCGIEVSATVRKDSIDTTPLGDIAATLMSLIYGHSECDILFTHARFGDSIHLDTRQWREATGGAPPTGRIAECIREYLTEQYDGSAEKLSGRKDK